MRLLRTTGPLVLLALVAAQASAQSRVDTAVDTTLVTVGDRITLTVSVHHAAGASVTWPDSLDISPFEALAAELLPPSPTPEGMRSTAVITMTVFELGELEIPSFDVRIRGPDGSSETLTTDRFGIEVVSVGADETGDIREIRGPFSIPIGVVQLSMWLIVLAILAVIAYWLWRRSRKTDDAPIPTTETPRRPAHEVALEALDALEASPMLERGQVKEYHIEVSEVLRRYLEASFRVEALEMTTREVLTGLRRAGVGQSLLDDLRRFLEQCDLVKFAKVRPDEDASRAVLSLGRRIVLDSRPGPDAPKPEEAAGSVSVEDEAELGPVEVS